MGNVEELIRRHHKKLNGYDMNAELVLTDASDYFASVLPKKVDERAWNHLLIYAPTSLLLRALWFRCTKRFRYRWRN